MSENHDNPNSVRDQQGVRRLLFLQLVLVVLATVGVMIAASLEARPGPTLGFFWFAFFAGCFGAGIGLLRKIRTDPGAIASVGTSWTALLLPHVYGGLLAGLTYFLFASRILSGTGEGGLLTSNLFPDFVAVVKGTGAESEVAKIETDAVAATVRNYLSMRPASLTDAGKLIVWSFIAGYAEGFVIGILDHLRRVEPAGNRDEA